jgi:NADH-quinone oxidoreductase subunit L
MMFALGVSGYGGEHGLGYMASMFHLFTHAMFKALLFLGAGSVIHYVHSNEMKDMGGLRKLMPVTHITFLVACLAIAGIPPFAGFFSKEEILQAAYHANKGIFVLAITTAAITAFYMFRLYFSIFWSKTYHAAPAEHGAHSAHDDHHSHGEGPMTMLLPLLILGALSVGAGFIPFGKLVTSDGKALITEMHLTFSIAPVLLATAGIFIALSLYKKENATPQRIADGMGGLYRAAYRKFYIDEVYLFITKKIVFNLIGRPAAWIDRNIIDGFMNLLATITGKISLLIKQLQSGKLQDYGAYYFAGVIGLVLVAVYWWR